MARSLIKPLVVAARAGLSVENPVGRSPYVQGDVRRHRRCSHGAGNDRRARRGPPAHVHAEDELIHTLEGTFRIKLGDALHELSPGTFVFIPGGTLPAWQNIGSRPGRFFATVAPGATAFEEFFRRYAKLPADQRGVEAFARLAAETRAFQVGGPPLAKSDPI